MSLTRLIAELLDTDPTGNSWQTLSRESANFEYRYLGRPAAPALPTERQTDYRHAEEPSRDLEMRSCCMECIVTSEPVFN